MSDNGEFYVGYHGQAPPGLAAFVRRIVAIVVVGAAALGGGLAVLQQPFDPGEFEFGETTSVTGWISEAPYPELVVPRPGEIEDPDANSRYLLVGPGKHGPGEFIGEHLDGAAQVEGTLIHREGATMIEVSSAVGASGVHSLMSDSSQDLGEQTLIGEIVDTKCYLGTMKPGRFKPHKSCAANCIRGGIPPAFLVETSTSQRWLLLLVDSDDRPLSDTILDYVGEPLEITGRVRKIGNRLILAADPASYRRIN